MARVTVEDCIENVPNRFELVVLAAQRAKQISGGAPLMIDRDNDKDAVVALREIADRAIDIEQLNEDIIQSNCTRHAGEEFEAIPFAGEMQDEVSRDIAGLMAEESGPKTLSEEDVEDIDGLSFEDENIDVED